MRIELHADDAIRADDGARPFDHVALYVVVAVRHHCAVQRFHVVGPSLEELRDLFDVGLQLETSAFLKLTEAGLPNVGERVHRADDIAAAVEQGNVLAYLEADRAFHLELLSRAGNRVLTDVVMSLRDKMRLYDIRSCHGVARQRASVAKHYCIIRAVEQPCVIDVTALIMKHIMD